MRPQGSRFTFSSASSSLVIRNQGKVYPNVLPSFTQHIGCRHYHLQHRHPLCHLHIERESIHPSKSRSKPWCRSQLIKQYWNFGCCSLLSLSTSPVWWTTTAPMHTPWCVHICVQTFGPALPYHTLPTLAAAIDSAESFCCTHIVWVCECGRHLIR